MNQPLGGGEIISRSLWYVIWSLKRSSLDFLRFRTPAMDGVGRSLNDYPKFQVIAHKSRTTGGLNQEQVGYMKN